MKTSVVDPWSNGGTEVSNEPENNGNDVPRFEDSFVNEKLDTSRLSDSEQYLERLCKSVAKILRQLIFRKIFPLHFASSQKTHFFVERKKNRYFCASRMFKRI